MPVNSPEEQEGFERSHRGTCGGEAEFPEEKKNYR